MVKLPGDSSSKNWKQSEVEYIEVKLVEKVKLKRRKLILFLHILFIFNNFEFMLFTNESFNYLVFQLLYSIYNKKAILFPPPFLLIEKNA